MNFLRTIVARKQDEVADRAKRAPLEALRDRPLPPVRDFAAALRRPGLSAIAEIKRKSPSRGPLREDLDPREIAKSYQHNSATAISVLTDREFFGGSPDDLTSVKQAVSLPVLRKDFVIDPYQLHESRSMGADAALLIVRILSSAQLTEYVALARELGLATLVEVHDQHELDQAVQSGAEIVGVNNRNLDTFAVSLETALRLKPSIPADRIAVAESGIHTREDVARLEQAGYDAFLVGESLMTAVAPATKLRELLGGTP
jgi:indole-3-glycerol phosphate synthase